jgi:hypothetical protein
VRHWEEDDEYDDDMGETGWVFGVKNETIACANAVRQSVLLDSGSDEHICRQAFGPDVDPHKVDKLMKLVDVQKRPLPTMGAKKVGLALGVGIVTAAAEFMIGPVNDDILSLSKLINQGCRFDLSKDNGLYMSKGHVSVQLYLERNSLRMEVEVAPARRVIAAGQAPREEVEVPQALSEGVVEVGVPGRGEERAEGRPTLSADSGVDDIRNRLGELKGTVYGTKAQLWARLC